MRLVDFTGGPPGSCAIVLVRDVTSPLWILVWVLESLHVPPSWARAFDMPFILFSLPFRRELTLSRVPPAALPAVPSAEADPVGEDEVAPTPKVEADVPPAAALPPVPPAAAPPPAPPEPN